MDTEYMGVVYTVTVTPVGRDRWDWSWSCAHAPVRGRNVVEWAPTRALAEEEAAADARATISQWLATRKTA
jgi:hypothetical protein